MSATAALLAAGFVTGTKSLTFKGSLTSASSGSNPYTFSSCDIGTASSGRYVHVAVFGNAAATSITGVTVNGISCTENVKVAAGNGADIVGIYTANVPSGTSVDIVVTYGGAQTRVGMAWWTSTGLSSAAASSTASDNTGTTLDTNVTAFSGGFVIATAGQNSNFTPSWTGVTQDFANAYATDGSEHTGASASSTSGGARTVNVAGATNGSSCAVAAAF